MRVKQLWRYVPLPAKLKLVYNRLTLSRITTAYFILALIHCAVQIVWQGQALGIERTQSAILRDVITAGNVTEKFAALDEDDHIELCHAIPGQSTDQHPCKTFTGLTPEKKPRQNKAERTKSRRSTFHLTPRAPVFTGHVIASTGRIDGVSVTGISGLPPVVLSSTCTQVLAWPDQIVNQAKREALAMIAFQLWLFGVSIVAILNESIPHVLAALSTHVLSTGWSSFQIARTEHFRQRFKDIVINGACDGINLMPKYWQSKMYNQIPILVLNGAALVASSFLSWKLFNQYGVQSFNRVGASPRMHRIYLLVLVLSVSLQMTAFFLVTALALWIEQLTDGPIAPLARHRMIYLGIFIATAVLILPWLYMGWIAVRRERRKMMLAFLFTSLILIATQTGMFISPIYRLTFGTWSFFATLTVAAYILLVGTFVMAVVCRTLFGRGLAHFLQVQDRLEECDFTPVYFEREDGEEVVGQGDEKGPMPWDEDQRVRRISPHRESEDSVQDISPSQIRTLPRVHFSAAAPAEANRLNARFVDQDYFPDNSASSASLALSDTPSHSPPVFEDGASRSGHKRESSTATWYHHPGGRDFIQRGVNTGSPVQRGYNTFPGQPVIGLPQNVKLPRRPPGLDVASHVPANMYAPGRI